MRWVALSCIALVGFSAAQGQETGPAKPLAMQSGRWESTTTITAMDLTGIPDEQAVLMRRQMNRPVSASRCVTAAEAADPLASMAAAMARERTCDLTSRIFSGGRIEIAGTCSPPGQGKVRLALTGTYTADRMNARMEVEGRMDQPGRNAPPALHMSTTVASRRTGPCGAKDSSEPDLQQAG